MTYQDIHAARFLARPNRFIAQVELDGAVETVHVKNTGRCRELLLPGCTVYLEGSANPARKTRYDLVAVEKGRPGLPPLLINMDAQAPNQVFREWMEAGGGQAVSRPGEKQRVGPFPVRLLLGENGRFTRNVRSAKGLCGGQGLHPGGRRPGPLPRRAHPARREAPA